MSLKKTTTQDKPHAVFEAHGWTWYVLKTYQAPKGEAKNQYARWFCAVSSPFTQPSVDLGDVYVRDITSHAKRTQASDEWRETYAAVLQ